MKKSLLLFWISVLFVSLFLTGAEAHPWNTSWDGCHYCWTNCSKWWYTYGTRHCHDGWTPSFGPADPLYYSSYNSSDYEDSYYTPPIDSCSRKYPGTVYQSYGDKCICANGNDWTKKFKCEKATCPYSDWWNANIGDISLEGYICTANWNWSAPRNKQESCNRKYPGTVYKKANDMCMCSNGKDWNISSQCN